MQHRFGARRSAVPTTRGRRLARPARGAAARRARAGACSPTRGSRRRGRGSTALAPAPTIDLTVHFRAPLPLDDTCCSAASAELVRDGFFDEDGELWAPDGTLVAQSRQLGLLIGAQA